MLAPAPPVSVACSMPASWSTARPKVRLPAANVKLTSPDSTTVSVPRPPVSVFVPAPPLRMLVPASPMIVSLCAEPTTLSKPWIVTKPVAVAASRLTLTPLA